MTWFFFAFLAKILALTSFREPNRMQRRNAQGLMTNRQEKPEARNPNDALSPKSEQANRKEFNLCAHGFAV
jgi:hypothetical protein